MNTIANAISDRLMDKYQITVTFTRYLSEDLALANERGGMFDLGLVKLFVAELGEAIQQTGEPAGFFEVDTITFWDKSGWAAKFDIEDHIDGMELRGPY